MTVIGLVIIFIVSLVYARPAGDPELIWGGMLRDDWLAFVFRMIFIFGAAATVLFSMEIEVLEQKGEFYILLLASTLGMNLMASSANLVMLYLAIETTSVPLYVLAGFLKGDDKSVESGFKYLLFGALTSTVMLYGFSLLYGMAGTTDIYQLAASIKMGEIPAGMLIISLFLVLVGFGFKVSIVPFHFWAPDVYEGAPTPIAGFLSTASKAAGFAVLVRVFLSVFPDEASSWSAVATILAVASMTLGNTLALTQKNIKRMLAYSSIAHAGFILMGVATVNKLGVTSVVFYLGAYLLSNLAAFGAVAIFWRVVGSDEIEAYAGLSRRKPWLALAMLVALLSLAGMPPLGGFMGKFLVFAAAVDAGLVWLAIIGVLNAIIGLYYYLVVLKFVYLKRSDDEDKPLPISRASAIALTVCIIGIIFVGTVLGPWFGWSEIAASALF
jgi:NADH-quinone oxidoreductase subunit N